jgi:hypothetical protein
MGLTLTLQHRTELYVYELFYETPESLNLKWVRGQTDYLLVNVWTIQNQWQGREPQSAYYWLRDERGLIRIGRLANYTLYRIRG